MRQILSTVVLVSALVPVAQAEEKKEADPNVAAVVKGNTEFALQLYAQLREKDGNLFFSPGSISTALAMTYAGARGETAEGMARALHFTLPPDRLHGAFDALLRELHSGSKRGYRLSVANGLWAQKGEDFLPAFVTLVRDRYHAALREVNFRDATEQARQEINAWVEKQTQDKIKDLLQPGVLSESTRLVLANAIYFKGDWHSPFKKDATQEGTFHVSQARTAKVPFMNQTNRFGYLENDTLQVLELPYGSRELAMTVLLPKAKDGLPVLEKALTVERLGEWLAKLRDEEVRVTLPRFKVTSEFSLNDQLAALGMKQAFSTAADFSGMNGRTDLHLSAVVHKAFVDVNEEGTEAAAATGAVIGVKSIRIMQEFRADHPFVFLIRDTRSGTVLFLGRVTNP